MQTMRGQALDYRKVGESAWNDVHIAFARRPHDEVTDFAGVLDHIGAIITRAVISPAHSLMPCGVAEGVPNQAQLAFLKQIGCDEMQ